MMYFLTGTQVSRCVWVVKEEKREGERWPAHLAGLSGSFAPALLFVEGR